MSKEDNYFTFPLAVLSGNSNATTALACLDIALEIGILNAGIGFKNVHGSEKFEGLLNNQLEYIQMEHELDEDIDPESDEAALIVGAKVCGGINLGNYSTRSLEKMVDRANSIPKGGPLVRMASDFVWVAVKQARNDANPSKPRLEHGISWREFRVLAAILSVHTNRSNFAFIGWEVIEARTCGFTRKEDFQKAKKAKRIPRHLAPSFTRKQIRKTCDDLEKLGFYARFRLSSGSRGGRMAYSFRHTREQLATAVCDYANFHRGASIAQNREEDSAKCRELLHGFDKTPKRAMSGPIEGQTMDQTMGQ